MIDCPWGNLSMHTFRKLPMNKPSKVKTGINKDNFLYYPILSCIASELMIHQGGELRQYLSAGGGTQAESRFC